VKDDYLWDGTGAPDEELRELEEALGGLRYEPNLPRLLARYRPGRARIRAPGWPSPPSC